MTRLQDRNLTPSAPVTRDNQHSDVQRILVWPDALLVPETDFEQLARELNRTHYDVRRRPGSISDPR